MAWIEITEALLLTKISGDELASIREAALADNQVDPIQPAIDQVTRYVRSRVGVCKRLGSGQTIPDELLDPALAILVVRIMPRVAGMLIDGQTSPREKAANQAEEILKDAARGMIAIEEPAVETTEIVGPPRPSLTTKTRNFTRGSQDGI